MPGNTIKKTKNKNNMDNDFFIGIVNSQTYGSVDFTSLGSKTSSYNSEKPRKRKKDG